MLLGRREDVEDAAADGELAAPLDQVGPGVRRARPAARRSPPAPPRRRPAEPTGSRSPRPRTCGCRTARTGATTTETRPVRRAGHRVGQPAQHGQPPADGVARGLSRSCGSVSQDGNSSTDSAGQEAPQRVGQVLASRPVAVTASTGRPAPVGSAAASSPMSGATAPGAQVISAPSRVATPAAPTAPQRTPARRSAMSGSRTSVARTPVRLMSWTTLRPGGGHPEPASRARPNWPPPAPGRRAPNLGVEPTDRDRRSFVTSPDPTARTDPAAERPRDRGPPAGPGRHHPALARPRRLPLGWHGASPCRTYWHGDAPC